MSSCQNTTVLLVPNFVIENYLGSIGRTVMYCYARLHPVNYRSLVLERNVNQRCIISVVINRKIVESELAAELLAGILEIKHITAVPYDVHRIDLAESDFYIFCSTKFFHFNLLLQCLLMQFSYLRWLQPHRRQPRWHLQASSGKPLPAGRFAS